MGISSEASLDGDTLAEPVRRLLDDDRARVRSCQVVPIGGDSGNPCTVGVDLIRGVAEGRRGRSAFSLVRKVVSDADVPGLPRAGYMAEPQDWNYWKREAVAYESGLLENLDGPVVPVRCLGVEDRGSTAVMWLDELRDSGDEPGWTFADHVSAAAALGEFNGRTLDPDLPRDDYPWLARDFSRGWLNTVPLVGLDVAVEDDSVWQSPALRGVFPQPLGPRIGALLADADALLELGSRLPTTLTHHDAFRSNLFRISASGGSGSARFRLIDWSFVGVAPVGEDLGHQLGLNIFHLHLGHDAPSWWAYEAAATRAYTSGLRRAGVDTPVDVLRAYVRAVAALRPVTFAASSVTWLSPGAESDDSPHDEPLAGTVRDDEVPWPQEWAAQRGLDTDELLHRWAAMLTWLLDLGDAARRDMEHL